jgi:hypothetical protein
MKTKIKKKEEGKKASRTSKCTYLVWDFKFTTGWLVKNRIYEAFVHNQSSQDNTGVLGSQSYARKELHLLNPRSVQGRIDLRAKPGSTRWDTELVDPSSLASLSRLQKDRIPHRITPFMI